MDIKRSVDDPQPYVVFDRTVIERSTATNIEDFLQKRLSMNTSTFNTGSDRFAGARSSFNLRGLGSGQTLILVDGRRLMNAITRDVRQIVPPPQPDLNGIPLSAVERIEVLPSTASGIYGGSATGGVINVILRRDYAGTEVRLAYENTFDTDSARRRMDLSSGFSLGSKTRVMFSGSYSDGNNLWLGDRDFIQRGRTRALANNPCFYSPPSVQPCSNPPGGAATNIASATGANLTLKSQFGGAALNSTITSVPAGYTGLASDNGAALIANAGRYNLDLQQTTNSGGARSALVSVPTIKSLNLTLNRQFGARVEGFLELARADNIGHFDDSLFIDGTTSRPTTLAAGDVGNPFQQSIVVTYPVMAGEGRHVITNSERRVLAGANVALPSQWRAGVEYLWSMAGNSSSERLQIPADTNAVRAAIQTGALNVFRDPSLFTQQLKSIPLLDESPYAPTRSTLQDVTARLGGPIGTLPAGALKLSAALEHRDEFFDAHVAFNSNGTISYRPEREQTVDSAYVELQLPLIGQANRRRLVQALDLQLSGRTDRYKTEGATDLVTIPAGGGQSVPVSRVRAENTSTNPTIALKWTAVDSLAIRASYGTGFLPPTGWQILSSLGTVGTFVITDPRRGNITYNIPRSSVRNGGNPDLKPEESRSVSAGLVFTPQLLAGLRLSLDYTRIEKTDNIATIDNVSNESLFPERVVRGPLTPADIALGYTGGPITFLDTTLVNISQTKLEAFDVRGDYRLETSRSGDFEFYLAGTYQPHFQTRILPTSPLVENAGHLSNIVTPANTLKYKGSAGLAWILGNLTLGWDTVYFDSYLNYVVTEDPARIAAIALNNGNGGRIPSQIYHDTFVEYRFAERPQGNWLAELLSDTQIQLKVRNVLNTRPPFVALHTSSASEGARFISSFGDPRLSSYTLTVTRSFEH